jgi:hypothetical protein
LTVKKLVKAVQRTAVVVSLVLAAAAVAVAGPAEQKIGQRIQTLQGQIDAGAKSGELTVAEKAKVQARLDKIRVQVEKFNDSKYGLGDAEVKKINAELDVLAKSVKKQSSDLQSSQAGDKIAARIDELQKQIDSGYNNGSLTGSEAKKLGNRLDQIRRINARKTKNGLTEGEIRNVETDLDKLAKQIVKQGKDKQRVK